MAANASEPHTSCKTASMCGIGHMFVTIAALIWREYTAMRCIAGGLIGAISGV